MLDFNIFPGLKMRLKSKQKEKRRRRRQLQSCISFTHDAFRHSAECGSPEVHNLGRRGRSERVQCRQPQRFSELHVLSRGSGPEGGTDCAVTLGNKRKCCVISVGFSLWPTARSQVKWWVEGKLRCVQAVSLNPFKP